MESTAAMDRITELPEPILHQILSFLPTRDVARTGTLSKRWNSVCFSSPILDFDDTLFVCSSSYPTSDKVTRTRKKFKDFVDESIFRREKDLKGFTIDKFRLNMLFVADSDSFVNNWLGFAMDHSVKELTLCLRREAPKTLILPSVSDSMVPQIAFNSKTITVLNLYDLKLESSVSISLPRLKTLSIVNGAIDDEFLLKIISGSSLIENLSITWCNGLKTVGFSSVELKSMRLGPCLNLEMVVIDAPNLQSFEFFGSGLVEELNIAACVGLRKLRLERDMIMSDKKLEDMVSQFVMLEDLDVDGCHLLENVAISSWNLKKLVLSECKNVVDLKISTPKLVSFTYSGNLISFDSTNSLDLLETKIYFNYERAESYCYTKLMNFLDKFNHCKVLNLGCNLDKVLFMNCISLMLFMSMQYTLVTPDEMIDDDGIRPPSYVKHLKVDTTSSCLDVSTFEEGLLWLFPNLGTLSIVSRFPYKHHKFKYKYCEDLQTTTRFKYIVTSWWCGLKNLTLTALKQRFMKSIKC